jgi:hypothetical protein
MELQEKKELVIDVLLPPLPPSPAKCVCLKLRVCERERRRERKDNASQKGGGEEDVEDAERKELRNMKE